MNTAPKEPAVVEDGIPVVLPAYLTENFEKAEAEIREAYGLSPGVPVLVRMWLGCAGVSRIRKAFELHALDITKRDPSPQEERYFYEDAP